MPHMKTHLSMVVLVLIWAVDVVTVSAAMASVSQVFLLCAKYLFALPVLAWAVRKGGEKVLPARGDIPWILLSALFGDILYYLFEYTAFKHLPVAAVTVLLGFLPGASYLTDCIVFRRRPAVSMVLPVLLSLPGLWLVVGTGEDAEGRSPVGIACCGLCIAAWILYGYCTRRLGGRCGAAAICLWQMSAAIPLMLPFAVREAPRRIAPADFLVQAVLMGVLSCGIGCLIEVRGLLVLGTTVSGVYLNLLPIASAAAGFVFLGEEMTIGQICGAALVIGCGLAINLQDPGETAVRTNPEGDM